MHFLFEDEGSFHFVQEDLLFSDLVVLFLPFFLFLLEKLSLGDIWSHLFFKFQDLILFPASKQKIHDDGKWQFLILFILLLECFAELLALLNFVIDDIFSESIVGLFAAGWFDLFECGIDKAGLELFCEFIFDERLVVGEIVVAADVADAGIKREHFHAVESFPVLGSFDFLLDLFHQLALLLDQQLIGDCVLALGLDVLL